MSIFLSPFPGLGDGSTLVLLPVLGNIVGERVIGVRGTKKSLNREAMKEA